MKNRTISIILTAVFALSLTACTDKGETVTEDPVTETVAEETVTEGPVTEEITEESEPAEEPEEEVAEELVLPEEVIEEITDNLWYTQVDWEVDPRWDEHEGENCIQICDIFLYDGEPYEEFLAELRNSEFINTEIERGSIYFDNDYRDPKDVEDYTDLNNVSETFNEYDFTGCFFVPEFEAGITDSLPHYVVFFTGIKTGYDNGKKIDGYGTFTLGNDFGTDEYRIIGTNWSERDKYGECFAESVDTGEVEYVFNSYIYTFSDSFIRTSKDDILTPVDMDFYLSNVNERYKIEHGMR